MATRIGSDEQMQAPAATMLDPSRLPYPFCPGCGHGHILDALDRALVRLGRPAHEVAIVTDIGCVGLSDQYFVTHAFHGLHGRAVTYATGIKLARPELTVVVLIGDGGCGIGGHHLISAARRNVGVTVLVFDNFNFGMTGGQHSVLTPSGSITATTPAGNLEAPMDVAATAAVNGASFVARTTAFDPGLDALIYEALSTDGFALLDIWELCTAYFVPNNRFSRKAMEAMLASSGMASGVLVHRQRPELARTLASASQGAPASRVAPAAGGRAGGIEPRFQSRLERRRSLTLAGAAGEKVRSAATVLARAAVLSGLYATQRDDYPVTVMTGHSISELVVSPEPIGYTGVPAPDILVVTAPEGAGVTASLPSRMGPGTRIYVEHSLAGRIGATRASVEPFYADRLGKRAAALAVLAAVAEREGLVSAEALRASVDMESRETVAQEMRQALEERQTVWEPAAPSRKVT
ncbi:thiamine pyrophosphate-dependent enzyme [Carboxydochorda subterranea]|uniref:Thiamine pyrophosphate-dependent enzyme n=1 Tax=Carboxydichorda subterranea TaxID=3109565 RepID=A0ABZ1BV54_9FIRM|nr:thiamine pyrophosphate-dependent enzyme [Limnochorda sp. L945t]WRP16473.1 thiamine pyrophosphate-dependent enzyme [Limnochorda sp. L945t]